MTGACYLLETRKTKVLVECGLRQGNNFSEDFNSRRFSFNASKIDAVFASHAHADHIGRIPKLVKEGFHGKIYSTPPTKDFAKIVLLDSEKIIREEAHKEGREPLYDADDIKKTVSLWRTVEYHEEVVTNDVKAEFINAGHILGSSCVKISAEGKTVVFSGDLGNEQTPFIQYAEEIENADYALIESAYGGRRHDDSKTGRELLEDIIEGVVQQKGTLLMPAFALERTQQILFDLNALVENRRIPQVPVFVDSPLAIKLTDVYRKYSKDERYFRKEATDLIRGGDAIFDFPGLELTKTSAQSRRIDRAPAPKIIIAGSGMSEGGRILRHERTYLSDPNTTLLFIGFQVEGSMGRRILDGAKNINIFGDNVDIKAKSLSIHSYSAHADQPRLLEWLYPMRLSLKKVFVVQGEEEQSKILSEKIRDEFAIKTHIPSFGETTVL